MTAKNFLFTPQNKDDENKREHEGSGGKFGEKKNIFEVLRDGIGNVRRFNNLAEVTGNKKPSKAEVIAGQLFPSSKTFMQRFDRVADSIFFDGKPVDEAIAEEIQNSPPSTTPSTGTTAKPIVYSDWSPAAQQFGMDQSTAYAEHIANTAHQREVADLRAAGLNPVLGAGSGASGVSGHVATSGSSAQKSLNGGFIVDAIGATAAVVTAILTKNPAYGYMAGNAVNAVGDVFTKTK